MKSKNNSKKTKDYTSKEDSSFMLNEPAIAYQQNYNPYQYIEQVREGISKKRVMSLAEKMGLSIHELSTILNLSERTIQRYEINHKLETSSSEKAMQLEYLYQRGIEVLDNESNLKDWLHTKVLALDGKKPIDFLDTIAGFQLVLYVLGRIEHGVFS
jgi:putative toxin-antitoxin system antitoxin component (TIGR02293 family)